MSTQALVPSHRFSHVSDPQFDPATGALQVGYRNIVATLSGTAQPIELTAWAIGFDGRSGASVRYANIKTLLGTVGGDGIIAIRLTGITGDQFGSMSERADLSGESAEIWITSVKEFPDSRGAVLTVLDGTLIQILTVTPYDQSAPLRSTHLIEAIATGMAMRSPQQFASVEPDRAALMDRLPALDDLPRMAINGTIQRESYETRM